MKALGRWSAVLALIAALVVAQLETIVGWYPSVVVTGLLLGIAATALNVMFGYTGMLSLGNGLFLGLAAITMGIGVLQLEWPVLPSLLMGVLVTGVFAFVAGLLLVRIPGLYFSVVMLGLAVAFEGLIRAFPSVTGGSTGLVLNSRLDLGFTEIVEVDDWFWFSLVVSAAVFVLVWGFTWGRTGRLLRLIRRDELAASVLGVDVQRAKLVVFVFAGTLTGFAGTLLFLWQRVLVPETTGLLRSLELVSLVVVGGLGTLLGGFVGALIVMWILELTLSRGNWSELIYGVAFLVVILYAPRGVVGAFSNGWRLLSRRLPSSPAHEPADGRPAPRQAHAKPTAVDVRTSARNAEPAPTSPVRDVSRSSERDGQGLVVTGVSRRFGGVVAVQEVSISVPPGALTGLVGANGAGKSTLMNLICGVETVDEGTIALNGQELQNKLPHKVAAYGVARTFQVPRLVDDMTVLENVKIGGDALDGHVFRKTPRDEKARTRQALDALTRADLGHLANRMAGTLGTGERKYAELVRALAWNPSVLLMDEPAVGLADHEIERLERWLRELKSEGTAVLLVDHNLDFVDRLVDHVYIMREGQVTEQGHPSEILKRAARRASVKVKS